MGRTARDNRDLPHLPPVERIELSWENYKLRIVAAVVFLIVGAAALTYAFTTFLGQEAGWQTIQANSQTPSCAGDFQFLYELGAGEASATAESRTLTPIYTQAAETAYRLFNSSEGFEGVTNVWTLNQNPNEVLTVDEPLYEAFELIGRYGDRSVYLGPVYEIYDDLFLCEEDWQTQDFDPFVNPQAAAFHAEVAAFARDPASVDVELLGEGQVRLKVSEEYLAYAEANEFDRFVDFYWLTNAFIVDYLAEVLTEQGYTRGSLSSVDGFIRNLDSREVSYGLNLYGRTDSGTISAAVMQYGGPRSIVSLRSYPLSGQDRRYYYQLASGEVRTPYLDTADGLCRSAADSLVCYSDSAGCAETLLRMIPLYIADTLETETLSALADGGIYAVWPEGSTICHTDPELVLTDVASGYTVALRP